MRHRRSVILTAGVAMLATLSACQSDGPGAPDAIAFAPASAAAFTVVEVKGLPAPTTTTPVPVTVGGAATVLVPDTAGRTWRLTVPDVRPGPVDANLSAVRGGRDRVPLQVLATPTVALVDGYAAGTPAQMVASVIGLIDSLQRDVADVRSTLDPVRDSLLDRLFLTQLEFADAARTELQALSPAARDSVGTVLRANAEAILRPLAMSHRIHLALAPVASPLAPARSPGNPRIDRGPGSADGLSFNLARVAGAERAETIIARCERLVTLTEGLGEVANVLTLLEPMLSFLQRAPLSPPNVRVIASVIGGGSMFVDGVSIWLKSRPFLPAAASATLVFQQGVLREGDTSPFDAQVTMRNIGYSVLDVAGTATAAAKLPGLSVWVDAIGGKVGALLGALPSFGSNVVLVQRFKAASDLLRIQLDGPVASTLFDNRLFTAIGGPVPIAIDGLAQVPRSGTGWALTVGTGSVGDVRVESGAPRGQVVFQPRADSRSNAAECSITPAPTRDRRNQFRIDSAVAGARVTLTDLGPYTLREGSSAAIRVRATNLGPSIARNLQLRLGRIANGTLQPWTGVPSWLSATSPTITSLGIRATTDLAINLTARTGAITGPVVVPVVLLVDGVPQSELLLSVDVDGQLADVVVTSATGRINIYDAGVEDDDTVSVELNGRRLLMRHRLLNAGTLVDVTYLPGRNLLRILAHNEGSLQPNTAGILIDQVLSAGTAVRTYSLATNEVTTLVIEYRPPTVSPGVSARVTGGSTGERTRLTPVIDEKAVRLERGSPR
jgi:hypothetical protein